jgi:hypothetical protein
MVVNRLQDGLLNSRVVLRVSRLNCQNIFFQRRTHTFFLVILIEIFILKTTNLQNALRYSVITKLSYLEKQMTNRHKWDCAQMPQNGA